MKQARHHGNLWLRKKKNGKTFLIGYIWLNEARRRPVHVLRVRVMPNKFKTALKQPDYKVYKEEG